jgi:hypothetical protein
VGLRQPADIIWALDNSGSMITEAQAVQDNMNTFAQQIVASGIDVRVVVLSAVRDPILLPPPLDLLIPAVCIGAPLGSGQCPSDSKPPNFLHLPVLVGSNDALNLLINSYPQYRSMLRPEATKTFVVVTDDEATDPPNNSAAAFSAAVTGLDPTLFTQWTFSGVYCRTNCLNCSGVGNVYEQLRTDKGGVWGDMCMTDFAPVFSALAQTVITGSKLACEWVIPPPPPGETFDRDKVNVVYTPANSPPLRLLKVPTSADCGSEAAWFYDNNTNPTKVLVCPEICTAIQAANEAKIDVEFGCASEVVR